MRFQLAYKHHSPFLQEIYVNLILRNLALMDQTDYHQYLCPWNCYWMLEQGIEPATE